MSLIRTILRSTQPLSIFTRPMPLASSRMVRKAHGGTAEKAPNGAESGWHDGSELGVGEYQGAKFKVEPLRRTGEDAQTMRARLLYQSRKRGTLESDLLMSTFADAHLRDMTEAQMAQYDLFLDENDWDIYYWATQEPSPSSFDTAKIAGPSMKGANTIAEDASKESLAAEGTDQVKQTGPELETDEWRNSKPRSGEWAQTVGTFKPAYRPVPARWRNSEILAMLRRHVISRSAGGIHGVDPDVSKNRGMAFMPPVFQTERPSKALKVLEKGLDL